MNTDMWIYIYIYICVRVFYTYIYIYVCVCLYIYIHYTFIYIHEDWSKTQIFFEQIWPCAGLGPEDSRALLSRVWFPPPGQGAIKRGRGADLPKRLVAMKRLCELQPPGRGDQRWKMMKVRKQILDSSSTNSRYRLSMIIRFGTRFS